MSELSYTGEFPFYDTRQNVDSPEAFIGQLREQANDRELVLEDPLHIRWRNGEPEEKEYRISSFLVDDDHIIGGTSEDDYAVVGYTSKPE